MTLIVESPPLGVATRAEDLRWYDVMWNPILGCSKVSTGCANCSSEWYVVNGKIRGVEPAVARGRWSGQIELRPEKLAEPLNVNAPLRIFVAALSDLFHEDVPEEFLADIFTTMALAPQHTYQLLTRRPARMQAWFKAHPEFQLANIWAGVSVEEQRFVDERVSILLDTACALRWVNVEPLLGPVRLGARLDDLRWVAVGPEIGPRARPCHEDWVRSLRDECQAARVPFFANHIVLDGRRHHAWPEHRN